MGNIEDSIIRSYKRSLEKGDIEQASLAVDLAKELRNKVENFGFLDYSSPITKTTTNLGCFFRQFEYSYDSNNGVVVINKSAICLTEMENRLFYLFLSNETCGDNINLITKEMIRKVLWNGKNVSSSAIRVMVRRLRKKIEVNPDSPQIIINFYRKGYLFLGKQINFVE